MPSRFRSRSTCSLMLGASLILLGAVTGCRQDMHDQPKMFPLRSTTFFPDGRSVRPQVQGTVARSQSESGDYFTTGMQNGAEGDGMPFPVTETVLRRGQERYNIYCTPCHSRVGNGKGMIVQRGYYQATSFHSDRLRTAPLGHFFSVITNGYGAMPEYSAQLTREDRWAVVAYIRALQLSQNATQQDVPQGTAVAPIDSVAETAHKEEKEEKEEKGDAAKGKTIYMSNCAVCHQPTRAGMPPIFPSLLGVVDRVGEARVRTVARTGIPDAKPPMPPHPNLSDKDITDLIAFLRTK
jgi:mono/diheme cytochrome c family protein